jgi:hypothetical protein
MPTTNDKFIFVNAPTIINAGPRDARRQLRSQLMRRVYLRKYQEPTPRIEHVVDTIEREPPKDDSEGESSSSRGHTTSPPMGTTGIAVAHPVASIDSKLPTPPSEGDGDDGCNRCGGCCRSPNQCQPVTHTRKKPKLLSPTKEAPLDLGPLLSSIAMSTLNPFAVPDDGVNAPNSHMLINHCKPVI